MEEAEAIARLRTESLVIACGRGGRTIAVANWTIPSEVSVRADHGRHGEILCPRGELDHNPTVRHAADLLLSRHAWVRPAAPRSERRPPRPTRSTPGRCESRPRVGAGIGPGR